MAEEFSAGGLAYFVSHGIEPATAVACGVREEGGALVFPGGRRRDLRSGITKQPAGEPLEHWWITEPQPDQPVLACEGEGDGLATASHLPQIPPAAGLDGLGVLVVPGCGFPVKRLTAALTEKGVSEVFLAFDANDAGRSYSAKVSEALEAAGIRGVIVELPDGTDLADQLAEADEPAEWLAHALVDAEAAANLPSGDTPSSEAEARGKTSWASLDLTAVLEGRDSEKPPEILRREDGVCLIYAGKLHSGSGEPEGCKGWFALQGCSELILAGRPVAYIDFEDDEATIVWRLLALGCSPAQIAEWFRYVRPHEPLTDPARADLDDVLSHQPDLVVIDGVTEALTIFGLDLNDNADSARFYELLPRPIVRNGAAVLLIDHVTKDRESRGRYAIGAQHKLAGVDVAYGLEVVEPFGRGRDGLVKVTVAKDRPGHVRRHADEQNRIAEMKLSSDLETGRVTVDLVAPGDATAFRPTFLMRRISEAVYAEPGITVRGIRGVRGNHTAKQEALRLLITEKYVDRVQDGQAIRHYPLRPFTEGVQEDETVPTVPTVPEARPDRAQAHPEHTVPRAPSPLGGTARGAAMEDHPSEASPRPTLEVVPTTTCTCSRPARSPRGDGPPVCMKCRKPTEVAA